MSRYTSETTGWAVATAYDPGGTTGWGLMCVKPTALLGKRELALDAHRDAIKPLPQILPARSPALVRSSATS